MSMTWHNSILVQGQVKTFSYLFLEHFLSLADPCDLRMCVDDRRYTVIVNVWHSSADTFYTNNTFIFCLVCQHRTMDCITNCEDAKNGEKVLLPSSKQVFKSPLYCTSKGFLHFTDKRIMLFVCAIKDTFFNFLKSSSHLLHWLCQYKMISWLVWNPLTLVQRTGTFHWLGPVLFDPVQFQHFPDQVYLCMGVDQYTPVTCHNQSTNEMNSLKLAHCSIWHLLFFMHKEIQELTKDFLQKHKATTLI